MGYSAVVGLLSILFGGVVASEASHDVARRTSVQTKRALFVGNSLTYSNDLPQIVQSLADSAGTGPLEIQMVTFPDFSLDDHRQAGDAVRAIAGGRWDVVVLQQGPSSLPDSRAQLLSAVRAYAPEIRRAGARVALYSVWPARPHAANFARAMESYELAAKEVDGLLFPVARAWLAAWKRDSTLELYSSDGLHPSELGSYLAALVMHATLFDRSPIGLPNRVRLRSGRVLAIPRSTAEVLQRAAEDVRARRHSQGSAARILPPFR